MKIKILICLTALLVTVTSCTSKTLINNEKETETTKTEEKTETLTNDNEVEAESETEKETEEIKVELPKYYVSGNFAFLRKSPSEDSELISTLYKNEIIVLVESDDEKWLESEAGYYVLTDEVEPVEDTRIEKYQLVEKYQDEEKHGIVKDSSGNIRDLPDLDEGAIIANLQHGKVSCILGTCKNDWYMVKYDNQNIGYISGEVFEVMTDEEYNTYIELPQKQEFDPEKASLIGSYTTNYAPVETNRGYNVEKGADEIDSLVIMPGANFNWCRDMGPCGEQEGYKASNEIANGQYVTGFGGGICQISSTLCGAVLTSDMDFELIERHQHSKAQAYIPRDLDATVSYPGTNLIIKNSNDFPVMIKSHYENGNITIELYKFAG